MEAAPLEAVPFQSWVERRDEGVVRQQHDYSCGAAALASLLTYYYLKPTEERQLLEQLLHSREAEALSFADIASLAEAYGLKSLGVALTIDKLQFLRQPAILALKTSERAHFSLLRGVGESGSVLLADPSWGNRWLSRAEFATYVQGNKLRVLLIGDRAKHRHSPNYFRSTEEPSSLRLLPSSLGPAGVLPARF